MKVKNFNITLVLKLCIKFQCYVNIPRSNVIAPMDAVNNKNGSFWASF